MTVDCHIFSEEYLKLRDKKLVVEKLLKMLWFKERFGSVFEGNLDTKMALADG